MAIRFGKTAISPGLCLGWARVHLTKAQLAEEIRVALDAAVPEVSVSLSQPIEMRTDEAVAGVRSDVGILIYGPDLDTLERAGGEVLASVRDIAGVSDARVELVAGLRYLRVTPDRDKLARYGLTVADVNLAAETMAVGHHTGVVLDGGPEIRHPRDGEPRATR